MIYIFWAILTLGLLMQTHRKKLSGGHTDTLPSISGVTSVLQ